MKIFKQIAYPIVATILLFSEAYGQQPPPNVFDIKKIIPTSPEAAILGRFGDIPIGYYTGTANVSIPIYTIKEDGLEIPIVLRYHGSGIKVDDEASWTGLGWSLEPTGSIIQVVNGKADHLDQLVSSTNYDKVKEGTLLSTYSHRYDDAQCALPYIPNQYGYSAQSINLLLNGHGQPDIYQYNFPGFSGKFYINPETQQPVLLDKKMEVKFVNVNGTWRATTLDGHTFFFAVNEQSEYANETSGLTWKLSRIELSNGRVITCDYSAGKYSKAYSNQSYHSNYDFFPGNNHNTSSGFSVHQTKYLKAINGSDVVVEFVLEDRDDMLYEADVDDIPNNGNNSTKRLAKINIRQKAEGMLLKSFEFTYAYFAYNTVGGWFGNANTSNFSTQELDKYGKRLKLQSVREIGYSEGTAFPSKPYSFTYNESIVLPLKTSFARDFWGYYNGKNNTKLIPDLKYYHYSGFPEYQNIPQDVFSNFLTGANRSTDRSYIAAGILTSVNYPTGGSTQFTYESNSFSNYNYPDVEQILSSTSSINVTDKNITTDLRNRQFTILNSQTIQLTAGINRGPNTSTTFENMLPSSITLTRVTNGGSNITPIKTWQMIDNLSFRQDFAADGLVSWAEDLYLEYVPNTYYVFVANLPDNLGAQNTSTNSAAVYSNIVYSTVSNSGAKTNYGAGLRVSRITDYSNTGVKASDKAIRYINGTESSGVLMSPLKHLYPQYMFFSKSDGSPLHPNYTISYNTVWNISSESSVPMSDGAGGSPIGYSRVEEVDYDLSEIDNGKKVYHYFNMESRSKVNNPDDPYLLNGMITREEVFNKTGDTIRKTLYNYSLKEYSFFRGFKIFKNFFGDEPDALGTLCAAITIGRYSIHTYPIRAEWYVLDSKNITEYLNGQQHSNQVAFLYNYMGQLVEEVTSDSEGRSLKETFAYPSDISTSSGVIQVMRDQNLYNSLITHKKYVNNVETYHLRNNYFSSGGLPVTFYSSESSFGTPALKEDVRIEGYGDYKTPVEIFKDGKYTTVLWSYNSKYPIVKIENCSLGTLIGIAGQTAIQNIMRNQLPTQSQINAFVDSFRSHPLLISSYITVFTHLPGVGLSSLTDQKGLLQSFEYDEFLRLKNEKDQHGNIVKSYDYYLRPQ